MGLYPPLAALAREADGACARRSRRSSRARSPRAPTSPRSTSRAAPRTGLPPGRGERRELVETRARRRRLRARGHDRAVARVPRPPPRRSARRQLRLRPLRLPRAAAGVAWLEANAPRLGRRAGRDPGPRLGAELSRASHGVAVPVADPATGAVSLVRLSRREARATGATRTTQRLRRLLARSSRRSASQAVSLSTSDPLRDRPRVHRVGRGAAARDARPMRTVRRPCWRRSSRRLPRAGRVPRQPQQPHPLTVRASSCPASSSSATR